MPLCKEKAKGLTTEETPKLLEKVSDQLYDLLDQVSELRQKMMNKDKILVENGDDSQTIKLKLGKRKIDVAFENEEKLAGKLNPFRDAVLAKWSKKVQTASGVNALNASKFSIQNTNAQMLVANQLADMNRLIKRTRINRTEAKVLGEDGPKETYSSKLEELEEIEDDGTSETKKKIIELRKEKQRLQKLEKKKKFQKHILTEVNDANTDTALQERIEIFDDTDFYKALLKELVDRRLADSNAASSVKWTMAKSEKNVEGRSKKLDRSSKDKKLKFTVQEKIQNFDAPRNTIKWSDEQIDELFSGLFGMKIEVNEDEREKDDSDSEEEEEDDNYIVNDGLKLFG